MRSMGVGFTCTHVHGYCGLIFKPTTIITILVRNAKTVCKKPHINNTVTDNRNSNITNTNKQQV